MTINSCNLLPLYPALYPHRQTLVATWRNLALVLVCMILPGFLVPPVSAQSTEQATEDSQTVSLGPAVSPGQWGPEDEEARIESTLSRLSIDAWLISPSDVLYAPLTTEQRNALNGQSSDVNTDPFIVGANIPLLHNVQLNPSLFPAPGAEPVRLCGGFLNASSSKQVVWTLAVESPEAVALRLHLTQFDLPENYVLYLYSLPDNQAEVQGPYTGRGPNNTGDFWTHTLLGSKLYLELRSEDPSAAGSVIPQFQIQEVAAFSGQFLSTLSQQTSSSTPESSFTPVQSSFDDDVECLVDARCAASSWPNLTTAEKAIALIIFPYGPYQAVCSGGLLSDSKASMTNYFLTANHCISDSYTAGNAEFFWRYTTYSCNGSDPGRNQSPHTLGASVLVTGSVSDFTLLLLQKNPPSGSVYLPWTTARPKNKSYLYRLSHPEGFPLCYSTSLVASRRFNCGLSTSKFLSTLPVYGTTVGGSSGSPLLTENMQVVGQLLGACGTDPYDYCSRTKWDNIDGRFAATFTYVFGYLAPERCKYTVRATKRSFTSDGGSGILTLKSSTGCPWTVQSDSSWIKLVSSTSGRGTGSIDYLIESNNSYVARKGAITVAGKTIKITQRAMPKPR